MYSDSFENPDGRKCDRCQKIFDIGFLVKHVGRYNYDCTFCKSCIEYFKKLIQDFTKK